jgi:hypothetical protein
MDEVFCWFLCVLVFRVTYPTSESDKIPQLPLFTFNQLFLNHEICHNQIKRRTLSLPFKPFKIIPNYVSDPLHGFIKSLLVPSMIGTMGNLFEAILSLIHESYLI